MKKTTCLIACLFAGSANALPIINGSFETGDFTGWSVANTSGGSSSVVTSSAGFTATDGTYFADLTANSLLLQDMSWEAGEIITFDWNFNANDYLPYNDYSIFKVSDSVDGLIANFTLASVSSVGNFNATGWSTFSYEFAAAGSGSFGFGVYNALDTSVDSQLYIDNVVSSAVVPEPSILALLGLGLAGFGISRRKNII